MIVTDTASSVAGQVGDSLAPLTPMPEAADLPSGVSGGIGQAPVTPMPEAAQLPVGASGGVSPEMSAWMQGIPQAEQQFAGSILNSGIPSITPPGPTQYGGQSLQDLYNTAGLPYPLGATAPKPYTGDPLTDVTGAMNELLSPLGKAGESGLRHFPLGALPGIGPFAQGISAVTGGGPNPTVGSAVGSLPQHVGPVPVRGPAEAATTFAGQSAGYIGADILTGGALTPMFGAQAALNVANATQQYQQGQISGAQYLALLAQTAPMALPLLPHIVGSIGDLARSPAGQAAVAKATELLKGPQFEAAPGEAIARPAVGERGALTPGEPPPEPLKFGNDPNRVAPEYGVQIGPYDVRITRVPTEPGVEIAFENVSGKVGAIGDLRNVQQYIDTLRAQNPDGVFAIARTDRLRDFYSQMGFESQGVAADGEPSRLMQYKPSTAEPRPPTPTTPQMRVGGQGVPTSGTNEYIGMPAEQLKTLQSSGVLGPVDQAKVAQALQSGPGEAPGSQPAAGLPAPEIQSRAGTQGALAGFEAAQEAPRPIESVPPSKATVGMENITRGPQEVVRDATARGASPDTAAALRQTMTTLDAIPQGEPLLDANSVTRIAAVRAAHASGSLPGVAGKITDAIQKGIDTPLLYDRQQILPVVKAMDAAIKRDLPNVQFSGEAVGRAANPASYVFEFPQDVTGLSPQTTALIDQVQKLKQSHLALLQATDPTTAQTVASHLSHIYEGEPESPSLVPRVPAQRGEVSIAQSRNVADWRVLPDAQMKDIPLVDHIMRDFSATDTGIHDALFRKSLLEKVGSTDKTPGTVALKNSIMTRPEEGPWYVPKTISDIVDQKYAPPPQIVQATARASRLFKGIVVLPADIGGIAQRLRSTGMQSISAGAGLLHHVLTSPMDWSPDSFDRAQFARDGVPQGSQGSTAFESQFPLGKIGARYGEIVQTPWQAVTYFSNLAHEGNLATMKLLGMDTSEGTAAGIANRQKSGDAVRAFRGASLGAQRAGRNAIEQWGLLSQQNSRALFSQLGVVSNLLRPGVSPAQRLLAAQAVASTAIGIWGVGSLVNMRYGNGQPLKLPVTWDSSTNSFKYNSNWNMIQTGGGYVTPMLPQASLVNAIAKSFTVLANEAVNRPGGVGGIMPAVGEAAKPFEQFGVGRAGPWARAGLAGAGIGYTPEGSFSNRLTGNQRLGAMAPQPISVSKGLISPSTIQHPGPTFAEQLAGTLPPFPPSATAASAAFKKTAATAGLPTADKGFTSQFWQQQLGAANLGDPSQYNTFADWKAAYVNHWTQVGQQRGMDAVTAENKATLAFDRNRTVVQFNVRLKQSERAFWFAHPDLVAQALQSDVQPAGLTLAEAQALAKRAPATTAAP